MFKDHKVKRCPWCEMTIIKSDLAGVEVRHTSACYLTAGIHGMDIDDIVVWNSRTIYTEGMACFQDDLEPEDVQLGNAYPEPYDEGSP